MRVFLLSPANTSGVRAQLLLRAGSALPLARRLNTEGAPLGEVFAFLSSLYFRGKLAYARAFGEERGGSFVITSERGLVPPEREIRMPDLHDMARVPIDSAEPCYSKPLRRDLLALAGDPAIEIVLLGSIATGKYVDLILPIFGSRALFPTDFIGRGDMSRGGLMLRCAHAGSELAYAPIEGALRRGSRPPKLAKLPPSPRNTQTTRRKATPQ